MQKNVASQKMVVFAFDRTTNLAKTGDAANITANLRKDNGAAVATNDVNPTETEDGFYTFDLTQAETNANVIQGFPASVTADIQVISVPGVIYTTPVNFGDDVIQTTDHTAGIADIPTVAEFNARTLLAEDYFDPATDAVANVTLVSTVTTNTDMRGTDSANTIAPDNTGISAILTDTGTTIPAQLNNMSGATFNTSTDSLEAIRDRGDLAWLTGAGGSAPTVVQIRQEMDTNSTKLIDIVADTNELQTNQGAWATATGFSTFNPTVDTVATVTTVTNMRGTDSALLAASYTAPDNTSITSILADTNELQSNQGNWLTATGFSTLIATDIVTGGAITTSSGNANVDVIKINGTNVIGAGTASNLWRA